MQILRRIAITSGATLGALGLLAASGLLYAAPAAADTTGYQTGYTYNQGLATGAGGALEANYTGDGDVASTPATVNSTDQAVTDTSDVSPSAPSTYTEDYTPVTIPATTNAANTPANYFDFSSPLMWLALIVLLAIIGLGVAALSRPSDMRTSSDYY